MPGNLTIDGRHGKITQAGLSKYALRLADGATNVRFLGLTLRGDPSGYVNSSSVYASAGIVVPANTGDVKVWECDIRGFAGVGVRVLDGAGEVGVQWCTIVGPGPDYITSTTFNFGAGLGFSSPGAQWSAEFNDISGYPQGIVTSDGQVNFRIVGNRIHDIPGQHGLYLEQVNRGVIANNVIQGTALQGMKIQMANTGYGDSELVSIHDNVFDGTGSHAILLTKLHAEPHGHVGFTIHDNLIRNSGDSGIYVMDATRGTIHDNVIDGTTQRGIHMKSTRQFSLHHNIIRNAGWCGLDLQDVTDFMVESNRIVDPAQSANANSAGGDYGVKIDGASSEGVLRSNRVSDATAKMRYGAIVASASDLATMEFYDNRMVGATAQGFRASAGSVPVRGFRGNTFEGAQGAFSGRPSNFALNPDTSGASVAALEGEVNELKALLRGHSLMP